MEVKGFSRDGIMTIGFNQDISKPGNSRRRNLFSVDDLSASRDLVDCSLVKKGDDEDSEL